MKPLSFIRRRLWAARPGRSRAGLLLACLACLAALALSRTPASFAQDILDDRYEASKTYLITLSGAAAKQSFQGVRGLLIIAPSPPGSDFHYVITVTGWPMDSERDSFVWNSQDTLLESVGTHVASRIVNPYSRSVNIFFFHLSDALFNREGMLTQREGERIAQVLKEARPTKIQAQAGELVLNFPGQDVKGTVWINGYDPVGKQYVRYQASLQGRLTSDGLKSVQESGQFN